MYSYPRKRIKEIVIDILGFDILGLDILGVDIMAVDIMGVDIVDLIRCKGYGCLYGCTG